MPTPIDQLRQLVDGTRPPPPIAALIGFTLTAVSPGEAVIELATSRQHANPMGALHGGVLCDIADAAMGIAYASTLAEGGAFATIELKINFLKPVGIAQVRSADAPAPRRLHRGDTAATRGAQHTRDVRPGRCRAH